MTKIPNALSAVTARLPAPRSWWTALVPALWLGAALATPRVLPQSGALLAVLSFTFAAAAVLILWSCGLLAVEGRQSPRRWLPALALLTAWTFASSLAREPQAVLGLAILGGWLLSRHPERTRVLAAPALGCLAFGVAALTDDIWMWSTAASAPVERAAGWLSAWTEGRTALGSLETTGLWCLVVAIPYWSVALPGGSLRRAAILLPLTAGALGAGALQLLELEYWIVPTYVAATAFLIQLSAGGASVREPATRPTRAWPALAAGGAAALAAFLPALQPAPNAADDARVVVHAKGEYSLVPASWDAPDTTAPKMGLFARYLSHSRPDFGITHQPPSELELRPGDALVLVNYTGPMEERDVQAVQEFVRSGGSLVVFADHTNMYGTADVYNELLGFSGIRVAYDTAVQHRWGWRDSLMLRRHATTAGGVAARSVRFGQGASLTCSGDARPLIRARYGFADEADWDAPYRLYLGDRNWQRATEPRDGMTFAAEEEIGEGRVIVYGDTSFLQASSFSSCWAYVDRLIAYALDPAPHSGAFLALPAAALLALVWILLLGGRRLVTIAAAAGFSLGATADGILSSGPGAAGWQPMIEEGAPLASIPMGSVATFDPYDDQVGVDNFTLDLERNGLIPLFTNASNRGPLPAPELIVLLPRAGSLPEREAAELLSDLESGSRLWVSAGSPESAHVRALTDALDIEIESRPLGRYFGEESPLGLPVPTFAERWPLDLPPEGEVWIEAFGEPVVARLQRGSGDVIWIADGKIFLNEWYEANTQRNSRFIKAAWNRTDSL